MSLPDIDGLEVAHQIRQDQINRSVRILAMSGRVSFGDKEMFIKNGCDGLISKPFTMDQHYSRIQNAAQVVDNRRVLEVRLIEKRSYLVIGFQS